MILGLLCPGFLGLLYVGFPCRNAYATAYHSMGSKTLAVFDRTGMCNDDEEFVSEYLGIVPYGDECRFT